jgi:hypothetical protein
MATPEETISNDIALKEEDISAATKSPDLLHQNEIDVNIVDFEKVDVRPTTENNTKRTLFTPLKNMDDEKKLKKIHQIVLKHKKNHSITS